MLKNEYVTKLINLKEVKFKNIDIQEDRVHFFVSSLSNTHLCPTCFEPTSKLVNFTPKIYRDLD